jgi:hypothetical protein
MAKRQIIPLEQLQRESLELYKSLHAESPLACALICGANIEKALMLLLRNFCLEKSQTADNLFKESGFLGSSHKCATMAYAVGLISKPLFENISTIEDIRNSFAHSHVPIDFSAVEAECRKLSFPPEILKNTLPNVKWGELNPRDKFNFASGITLGNLMFLARRIKHSETRKEWDWWSEF